MNIITISGKARYGKDTTANQIKWQLEDRGCTVLITHYADVLKFICKNFFGWDGQKNEEGRTLLQYVGTDVVRKKNPNYWVEFMTSVLDMFPNEWDYVVIPDCRFPNEINDLKDRYNVCSLVVDRGTDFDNGLSEEQKKHKSEVALDNYKFDYKIDNSGTLEELEEIVDKFLQKYLENEI